jgi:hypothetical protein
VNQGPTYSQPPADDELEVSIFGPGFGESIAVHLGAGEWFLVDSCIDLTSGQIPVLDYLRAISVDPSSQVHRVLASHWHDDHVRGIDQVIDECKGAKFFAPNCFSNGDFHRFIEVHASADPSPEVARTKSITKALRTLLKQNRKPGWSGADRFLFKSATGIEVYSLSPSDNRVTQFLKKLPGYTPKSGTRRAQGDLRPNDIATALVMYLGDRADTVLLGSDLEESPGRGWTSILNDSALPVVRGSLYKVAHHGSKSGEHADIWAKLLQPNPVALLTPYNLAGQSLPTVADVSRVQGYTDRGYIAARTESTAPSRLENVVERELRTNSIKRERIQAKMGHVRARRKLAPQSPWNVECFDNAVPLSQAFA